MFKDEYKIESSTYHFEYVAIQNKRNALVRHIHLWHSMGFPASIAIYSFFANFALGKERIINIVLLVLGAMFGTIIIKFTRKYTKSIDKTVVQLYPRIIALEIMLGYQFFRNYLKNIPKGTKEIEFVKKCENFDTKNPNELWEKIIAKKTFNPEDFDPSRRGHGILDKAANGLSIMFFVVSFILIVVSAIK